MDDGYAGFARIAAPIFAEYDCPVTLFVTTGFLDGQLWLWWDRVTYLFKHTQRSSLVFRLGGEERAYRWSTSGERDEAQHDVLRRLEWIDAPLREATIAGLSRQFDVEVPASPPPACAPISWDEVESVRPDRFTVHTALDILGDRDPWRESMPKPQRLSKPLIEEGHQITPGRVQAMHEGKRRARARER